MSDVTNPELTRAYELIEGDDLEKARVILDSYLETHRNDADAWWLYAHAVSDPMEAQNALRNVLRLDPDYPGAKGLLSESEQILTPASATSSGGGITRLASRPVQADDSNIPPDFLDRLENDDDLDDDFDLDDEFDDEFEEGAFQPQRSSRRILFLFVAILIAVVLISAALAITNQQRNNTVVVVPTVTITTEFVIIPTQPGDILATPDIAITSEVEATSEIADPAETEQVGAEGDFGSIYAAMSGYTTIPGSANIEQTSSGSTFLISVCNDVAAGGLMTTALNAIETLAAQSGTLSMQAEAIGARIVDCNRDNLLLRILAVSVADAEAFTQGSLSLNELRSRIRPVTQ